MLYHYGEGNIIFRIAICDDEKIVREQVFKMLLQFSMTTNIECEYVEFDKSSTLLEKLRDFDILFLDIVLKDNINGIQIGKKLRDLGCNAVIIILSSLHTYVNEGYKIKAFRYLEKPLIQSELDNTLLAAIEDLCASSKKLPLDVSVEHYFLTPMTFYSSKPIIERGKWSPL